MARPLVQALPAFIHLQHKDLSTVPEMVANWAAVSRS